jgi:hypothetical protein
MSDDWTVSTNGQNMSIQDAAEKARLIVGGADTPLLQDDVWNSLEEIGLMPSDRRKKRKITRLAGLDSVMVNGEECFVLNGAEAEPQSNNNLTETSSKNEDVNRRSPLKPLAITNSETDSDDLPVKKNPETSKSAEVMESAAVRTQQEVHTFNLKGGTVMIESKGKTITGSFTGVARVIIYLDVDAEV